LKIKILATKLQLNLTILHLKWVLYSGRWMNELLCVYSTKVHEEKRESRDLVGVCWGGHEMPMTLYQRGTSQKKKVTIVSSAKYLNRKCSTIIIFQARKTAAGC